MTGFFLTNIDDINKEILLLLEDEDLLNTNIVNKYAVALCANDNFWSERIQRIYKVNLSKYKEDDLTYRQVYFILRNTSELVITAAEHGYLPLVQHIRETDPDIYSYDKVLATAIINKNMPVVTYLIESGVKIFPQDKDIFKSIVEGEDIYI